MTLNSGEGNNTTSDSATLTALNKALNKIILA